MPAKQLKETTMNPKTRTLLRITLPSAMTQSKLLSETDNLVDRLMGKHADKRFEFIQENAQYVQDFDI